MGIFLKDPLAAIDYAIDWSAGYLGSRNIIASTWQVAPVEPGGIAIASARRSASGTSVTLSGGITGHVYRITNCVTLSDTSVDERSVTIRVEVR